MKGIVGFGLRPKKDELVGHYLYNKNLGNTGLVDGAISEVNIYSFDPWNLPFQSKNKSTDREWYFFSPIKNKYARGKKQNRTTGSGKWKLTGDPVDVKDQLGIWSVPPGKKIGHKRVVVFLDRTNTTNSDWVIHEFHCELLPEDLRTYVICKLKYKGNDIKIAKAGNPTPSINANITSSEGSVVNQSRQENSGFYNTYPEYDSANQIQQYIEDFNMPEFYPAGQLFSDNLLNQQPIWEYRSVCIPEKPVTGFFTDNSSNSDTDSAIGSDNSRWTHTPIDDTPSLNTIEPFHSYEPHEQPKLLLQGKQKVINMQESDSIKKTPSTKWIVLEEISQRNSQWTYLKNMIVGFLLFISIIRWIILV